MTCRIGEHRVHDGGSEVARDHDLLEESAEDQVGGAHHVDVAWVATDVELGDQLVGSDDRPGHQVREEREVQEGVDPRGGLEVAAVDVDDVGDRHEGEERDADGQDHLDQRHRQVQTEGARRVGRVDGEEAVVLEVQQRQQREAHRDPHRPSTRALLFLARNRERPQLRDQRDRREEPDERGIPPRVEDVARADHEQFPHERSRVEEPMAEEDHREEDGEVDGGEEHRQEL